MADALLKPDSCTLGTPVLATGLGVDLGSVGAGTAFGGGRPPNG